MKKGTCILTAATWKWLPSLPLSVPWKEPGHGPVQFQGKLTYVRSTGTLDEQ